MSDEDSGPVEIAFVGDLTDQGRDLAEKLLEVPTGGECTLYFDSAGGSSYTAISLMTILNLRNIQATGIVTGECSSAAVWPFAACVKRYVTPYSVLLFHPTRWESEENIGVAEAAEWARHYARFEPEMDRLLCEFFNIAPDQLAAWVYPGRYVSGQEMVDAGLAEMLELKGSGLLPNS